MATASPTPFPPSLNDYRPTRTVNRQPVRNYSTRPALRRHSPLSVLGHGAGHGFSADAPMIQRISIGDSSDDEIPQPMNFSALTKAILEGPQGKTDSPQANTSNERSYFSTTSRLREEHRSRAGTPSRGLLHVSRQLSPQTEAGQNQPSPRIVHLSATKLSSSHRPTTSSIASSRSESVRRRRSRDELATPGPGQLSQSQTSARESAGGHDNNDHAGESFLRTSVMADEEDPLIDLGDNDDYGKTPHSESALRRSHTRTDVIPGSTRLKRVPIGSGTFLRGAPMRRGIRRRQSDEEGSLNDDGPRSDERGTVPADSHAGGLSGSARHDSSAKTSPPKQSEVAEHSTEAGIRECGTPALDPANLKSARPRSPVSAQPYLSIDDVPEPAEPVFKIPALPPQLGSAYDQENEPPPTFKRNKPHVSTMLASVEKLSTLPDVKASKVLTNRLPTSPQPRPALASRDINTPRRAPPPPPPKMTVLDTATVVAGASSVKRTKKQTRMTVNGKAFEVCGPFIGKGGSSRVYRVIAENGKIFALKRVKLESESPEAVRGFKGEIDLLKKLDKVDRVVRMYDWEINDEKQSLSVLMEIGESDLNHVLSQRIHPEDARFDVAFTRFYWKEMLRCLSAVHDHDIVHSDLKPANFLLVQGQLKLIDFGIANAIDTDNTVNVHRDGNIGTPNYMSPETLLDTNAAMRQAGAPVAKLIKFGKASDVWSLGCILYQMTYGRPPFAHIANQMSRIQAICNPSVSIAYPTQGVGGVVIPRSLRSVLRQCLERDPSRRATVEYLMSEREPFLNPDAQLAKWEIDESGKAVPINEELLGQILQRVVERCRDPKRGPPTDSELRAYPKGFLDRIRDSLEKS